MTKKQKLYIVNAYRHGDNESHSYTLAVFDNVKDAIKCAKSHADYRGGKYACTVEECIKNYFDENDNSLLKEVHREISQLERHSNIGVLKITGLNNE